MWNRAAHTLRLEHQRTREVGKLEKEFLECILISLRQVWETSR